MHYLLIYTTAADHLTRRSAFRNEHLALAWQVGELATRPLRP
jgi:hypothetical protein